MIDFINAILQEDDFETLLGDLYAPTVSAIVVSWCILSFGALCQAFICLVTGLFKGGR